MPLLPHKKKLERGGGGWERGERTSDFRALGRQKRSAANGKGEWARQEDHQLDPAPTASSTSTAVTPCPPPRVPFSTTCFNNTAPAPCLWHVHINMAGCPARPFLSHPHTGCLILTTRTGLPPPPLPLPLHPLPSPPPPPRSLRARQAWEE